MNPFVFKPSPTVVYGPNESLNLAKHLKELGATKVAIVYDPMLMKVGLMQPILDAMGDFPYVTSDKVEPESPDTAVEEIRDALRGQAVDAVVAVGGGSAIDTARAAMLLSETTKPVNSYFTEKPEVITADKLFVAIPTTAGTGAEMSAGGPIYDTVNHKKGGLLMGPKQTDVVILDPMLTLGVPPFTTYCCAMDALDHSVEDLTGKLSNAMTDMMCMQAIQYVWENIPIVMEQDPKNVDARGKLQLAANYSIGCQSLRHMGHAVCQPIGGKLHLPHGYTCALVTPAVFELYAKEESLQATWKELGKRLGLNDENPAHTIAVKIAEMNKKYNIPTLQERGYSEEDVMSCIDVIMSDGRLLPNCPRPATREEAIYCAMVMYRGLPVEG